MRQKTNFSIYNLSGYSGVACWDL